jgi:hypothetical protein
LLSVTSETSRQRLKMIVYFTTACCQPTSGVSIVHWKSWYDRPLGKSVT